MRSDCQLLTMPLRQAVVTKNNRKAPRVRGIVTRVYEAPEYYGAKQVYIDTARQLEINKA